MPIEGFNVPKVLGFPLSEANNNNISKDRSGFIKLLKKIVRLEGY